MSWLLSLPIALNINEVATMPMKTPAMMRYDATRV